MIWIVPIGGRGTRTQPLGKFKPFIEIKGQKMLFWALYSMKNKINPQDLLIFTTTKYFRDTFNVDFEIKRILEELSLENNFEIYHSREILPGPSPSVYLAKQSLQTPQAVVVMNCDLYDDFAFPTAIAPQTGFITVQADFGKNKGYVEVKNGIITKFAEKEPISNIASTGIYLFPSGYDLVEALENQLKNHLINIDGEYSIGPTFNYLIQKGYQIYPLPVKAHYSLGNIEAINYFLSSNVAEALSKNLLRQRQLEKNQTAAQSQTSNYFSLI